MKAETKEVHTDLLPRPRRDEAALPPVRSEPLLAFDKCVCFRCEAERPAEKCPGECDEAPGTKQDYDCAHCPKHEHCEGWLYDNVDPAEYW